MSAPQVRINGAQMCPECAPHVDFAIHGFQATIARLTAERDKARSKACDELSKAVMAGAAERDAVAERDAARAELAALRERADTDRHHCLRYAGLWEGLRRRVLGLADHLADPALLDDDLIEPFATVAEQIRATVHNDYPAERACCHKPGGEHAAGCVQRCQDCGGPPDGEHRCRCASPDAVTTEGAT